MAYFSGIGVHKDGFQVAHEQRVHVHLLAQAFHGNEIEMESEFGEVEDFHRLCAARPVRGSQSAGFLPDSLLGIGALNWRGRSRSVRAFDEFDQLALNHEKAVHTGTIPVANA